MLNTRSLLIFISLLLAGVAFAQDYNSLVLQGDANIHSKKYDEAIVSFTKAIAVDSVSAAAYAKRGYTYFLLQKDSLGIADYTRAIQRDPNRAEYYFMRGQMLGFRGDPNGAQADYGAAINLDTNYVAAYIKRGYAFLSMGMTMPAFVMFTKAIIKDSNQTAEVYFARGYCVQQQSAWQQAMDDYARAIRRNPNYADAYLNSGNCARMLMQHDKALVFYEKALTIKPDYSTVYYARGFVYLDQGKTAEACADWKKAVSLGDKNAQTYIDQYCK